MGKEISFDESERREQNFTLPPDQNLRLTCRLSSFGLLFCSLLRVVGWWSYGIYTCCSSALDAFRFRSNASRRMFSFSLMCAFLLPVATELDGGREATTVNRCLWCSVCRQAVRKRG